MNGTLFGAVAADYPVEIVPAADSALLEVAAWIIYNYLQFQISH